MPEITQLLSFNPFTHFDKREVLLQQSKNKFLDIRCKKRIFYEKQEIIFKELIKNLADDIISLANSGWKRSGSVIAKQWMWESEARNKIEKLREMVEDEVNNRYEEANSYIKRSYYFLLWGLVISGFWIFGVITALNFLWINVLGNIVIVSGVAILLFSAVYVQNGVRGNERNYLPLGHHNYIKPPYL